MDGIRVSVFSAGPWSKNIKPHTLRELSSARSSDSGGKNLRGKAIRDGPSVAVVAMAENTSSQHFTVCKNLSSSISSETFTPARISGTTLLVHKEEMEAERSEVIAQGELASGGAGI